MDCRKSQNCKYFQFSCDDNVKAEKKSNEYRKTQNYYNISINQVSELFTNANILIIPVSKITNCLKY